MTAVVHLRSPSQSSSLHQFSYHKKEAARVVRRCALCQDVPSVGGDAVAIFNTGASKTPKLSMVGLVLAPESRKPLHHHHHHHQRGVFISMCKVTGRRLGGASEAPLIDCDFQLIFALTQLSGVSTGRLPYRYSLINQASLRFIHFCTSNGKPTKTADRLGLINHIQPTLLLH